MTFVVRNVATNTHMRRRFVVVSSDLIDNVSLVAEDVDDEVLGKAPVGAHGAAQHQVSGAVASAHGAVDWRFGGLCNNSKGSEVNKLFSPKRFRLNYLNRIFKFIKF